MLILFLIIAAGLRESSAASARTVAERFCSYPEENRKNVWQCTYEGDRRNLEKPWEVCGSRYSSNPPIYYQEQFNCEEIKNGKHDYLNAYYECVETNYQTGQMSVVSHFVEHCEKKAQSPPGPKNDGARVNELFQEFCSNPRKEYSDLIDCMYAGNNSVLLKPWLDCGPEPPMNDAHKKAKYNCAQYDAKNETYLKPYQQCVQNRLSQNGPDTIKYFIGDCEQKEHASPPNNGAKVKKLFKLFCAYPKEKYDPLLKCSYPGERQRLLKVWTDCGPEYKTTDAYYKALYNCAQYDANNHQYLEPYYRCVQGNLTREELSSIKRYVELCERKLRADANAPPTARSILEQDFCTNDKSIRGSILDCAYPDNRKYLLKPWMNCGSEFPTRNLHAKGEYNCKQVADNNQKYLDSYSKCVTSGFTADELRSIKQYINACARILTKNPNAKYPREQIINILGILQIIHRS